MAEVTVSESRIIVPISGVIARLNIEQGRYFTPQLVQTQTEQTALDTVPVVIIDPASYEITVELPSYTRREVDSGDEALIRRIEAPAPAPCEISALAGRTGNAPPIPIEQFRIFGRVFAVSPALDLETRTYDAIIGMTAGAQLLQDGEFVSTWIRGARVDGLPVVPFDALRLRSGEPYVFVVDRKTGRAELRDVELGLAGNAVRAVLSGVPVGELVVTDGKSALSDGDVVRVIGRARSEARDGTADE
ncbi:hypothetical protein J3454_08590 [Erythrobacter sp. NFXS35]|uniref:efflux RND transporter periplasmic adaptor subunit n=1 Tax=Erythrobacter sp. NFXS35 TaxID=2818436 RepID=UPI0032E016F8